LGGLFFGHAFLFAGPGRLFDPTLGVGNVPYERRDKKHDKK
jgi:hypothetical protein